MRCRVIRTLPNRASSCWEQNSGRTRKTGQFALFFFFSFFKSFLYCNFSLYCASRGWHPVPAVHADRPRRAWDYTIVHCLSQARRNIPQKNHFAYCFPSMCKCSVFLPLPFPFHILFRPFCSGVSIAYVCGVQCLFFPYTMCLNCTYPIRLSSLAVFSLCVF